MAPVGQRRGEEGRWAVAEVLAALTYGQRLARRRSEEAVGLAPDAIARDDQSRAAAREAESLALLEARLGEMGHPDLEERFHPFFDAFFDRTVPEVWAEAQAFHYIGDALVAEFAEALMGTMDRVSAEVVRRALCERDEQAAFALDQIKAVLSEDPGAAERVASYVRRVAGEALTQTRRALDSSETLQGLLGDAEEQKRILLGILDRHRRRLDRLGIEPIDDG
jgi:hypothetical protein